MKFTAALLALAAAIAAPLAAAQTCTTATNVGLLGNLTATSTIKKTTVTGGHRIVQSITIKNNAAAAAGGLSFTTAFDADETFLKGNARIWGSAKPTVTASGTLVSSSVFSIPAGKMLKATVVWKAKNCPTIANPRLFGLLTVKATDANAACVITKPAISVRLHTHLWIHSYECIAKSASSTMPALTFSPPATCSSKYSSRSTSARRALKHAAVSFVPIDHGSDLSDGLIDLNE
jgi:hypothetical protein